MSEELSTEKPEEFKSARPLSPEDAQLLAEDPTNILAAEPRGRIKDVDRAYAMAAGIGGPNQVYGAKFNADYAAEHRAKEKAATDNPSDALLNGSPDFHKKHAAEHDQKADYEQEKAGYFYDQGIDPTEIKEVNGRLFQPGSRAEKINGDFNKQRDEAAARLAEQNKAA